MHMYRKYMLYCLYYTIYTLHIYLLCTMYNVHAHLFVHQIFVFMHEKIECLNFESIKYYQPCIVGKFSKVKKQQKLVKIH